MVTQCNFNIDEQNNNLIQTSMYGIQDGIELPSLRTNMEYENDLLTMETWSWYDSTGYFPSTKIDYQYEGNKLKQTTHSYNLGGAWQIEGGEVATYSGDTLQTIMYSQYSDGSYFESYKYELTSSTQLVTKIEMFMNSGGNWEPAGILTYTYDAHGNLLSDFYTDEGFSDKTDYTYEQGKGNFSQFNFMVGGIAGDATPGPTMVKKNLLKDFDKNLARWIH